MQTPTKSSTEKQPWNRSIPDLEQDTGLSSSVISKLSVDHAQNGHLIGDLKELATLTLELMTAFSPGASKRSDELDRAGVEIWNHSILLRQSESFPLKVVGFARRAACLLLDAASRRPLEDQTLLRLLVTFTRALQVLAELKDMSSGEILLERAAALEAIAIGFPESAKKENTLQNYWLVRSAVESLKGNQVLLDFFLSKSVGQFATRAADAPTVLLRTEVAKACLDRGVAHLKEGKGSSLKSVKWLQLGIKVLERLESYSNPQVIDMLTKALRKLARACLLASEEDSSMLAAAETSIKEYSKVRRARNEPPSDSSLDFLRFEIQSRRDRSEEELSASFDRTCDGMEMNTANINKALQLLRSHFSRATFYSNGFKSLLNAALDHGGHDFIAAILLTFTFSIKSRQNLDTFDSMLNVVSADISFDLPADAVFACQASLWKSAQFQCEQEQWGEASNHFALSIHSAFVNSTNINLAKGYRKVAFCFLQAGKPETALRYLEAIPGRCPSSATTYHLEFLAHLRMKSKSLAVQALDKLVRSSDFQGSMLLNIVKELQASGYSDVLLKSLSHLSDKLDSEPNLSGEINPISLNRSIVKICVPEDGNLSSLDPDSLAFLLSALKQASETLSSARQEASNGKESVWMSRTVYNLAIKNIERVDLPVLIELFDSSLSLLKISEHLAPESSTEVKEMKVWCKVISLVAKFAGAKEVEDPEERLKLFTTLLPDVEQAKQLFSEAPSSKEDSKSDITYTLILLEWEALIEAADWRSLETRARGLQEQSTALPLLLWEQLTDMVWKQKECPEDLVVDLLQNTIHSLSFAEDPLSINRLSAWQRALLSYKMRNDSVDSTQEVLRIFQECLLLLKRCSSTPSLHGAYPSDEIQWLLAESWNRGVQLFNVGRLQEAKGFCEVALSIAAFTGKKTEEAVRQNYQKYLSHFADRIDQEDAPSSSS